LGPFFQQREELDLGAGHGERVVGSYYGAVAGTIVRVGEDAQGRAYVGADDGGAG
jgi:hypothetical protein